MLCSLSLPKTVDYLTNEVHAKPTATRIPIEVYQPQTRRKREDMSIVMARIRRPVSYKLRFVALILVAAIFTLYITLPDFGDGDSIFNKDALGNKGPGDSKTAWPRNQVQFPFKLNGRVAGDQKKAEEVKAAMKRTFWKYRLGAWGADEIKPISGQGRTTRWGFFLPMQMM